MTDWKPELDWLGSPEIHRQEIFDLTPSDSPNREQFVDALISHLYCTRIRPENVQAVKNRARKNPLARKAKARLETLRKAKSEAVQTILEFVKEVIDDPGESSSVCSVFRKDAVMVGLTISRMEETLERLTLGIPEDARTKELESRLVAETLALWKYFFPESPLPCNAMQGRTVGGHEPCRPARLCQLVLEFATGTTQNDITRLYEKAVERLDGLEQTPGMITLPL